MVGALVNERCNLVRVLDPVREGRSNKLALNLIFSVKADSIISNLCVALLAGDSKLVLIIAV